ncbi:MAG: hypothetical protein ACQEQ4_09350 [Fibrobacterota bacterium]
MTDIAEIQSNGSTLLVFFFVFLFFHFFEDLFGLKGVFKVIAAGVIAFLYRNYWYVVWTTLLELMVAYGLGDLIR